MPLTIVLPTLTILKKLGTLSPMTVASTHETAIQAALTLNWKEAIRINLELLKTDESNVAILNRLGYAYLQNGQPQLAKKHFQRVLTNDQYNQIALKNMKKLQTMKNSAHQNGNTTAMSPLLFLEDPGKTKIVQCINTAPDHILSGLMSGQEVFFKAKKYCVEIRDTQDTYLGALPDDLSFKLLKYLEAGNTYQAIVKSISKNQLTLLLRELTRGKKFANQPSFISTTSYIPFSRADVPDTDAKPDMTATGEENEEEKDSPEE